MIFTFELMHFLFDYDKINDVVNEGKAFVAFCEVMPSVKKFNVGG